MSDIAIRSIDDILDRQRRALLAEERVKKLKITLQVERDLPFWLRRIRFAARMTTNTWTTNHWSIRANDPTQAYVQELSRRLGDGFTVELQRKSGYAWDHVQVSW